MIEQMRVLQRFRVAINELRLQDVKIKERERKATTLYYPVDNDFIIEARFKRNEVEEI